MATIFDPPVDVDLGTNPGRVNFNTVEQARLWIQEEQEAWGEKLALSSDHRPLTAIVNRIIQTQRSKISHVDSAIGHFQSDPDDEATRNALTTALEMYADKEVLHSTSILGRKAIEMFSAAESLEDKTAAYSFLGAAIGHPAKVDDFRHSPHFQADYVAIISGVAQYYDFVSVGDTDIVEKFEGYARDNLAEWEKQLALHMNEHFDAVEVIKDKEQKITDEHARQESEFDTLKQGYETSFSEFEEFYKEGLRAKAPVKYWQSKAMKHASFGFLTFALFFGGCVAAAIYGFTLGSEFSTAVRDSASAISTQTTQPGETSTLLQLAFSKFLVLLVPGFFAVWMLRILLKVALSNLAIADDARHRVTMVETFLSLMEHTDKLDESDRILMLQALFRPIPGSNDEDTGPPNWFDVMMTQVKKN